MIKVVEHGPITETTFPGNGKKTRAQRVKFEEQGRGGANTSLNESSAFLDQVVGGKNGLDQIRTHTQSIPLENMHKYPIGQEIEGFINRRLYSFKQMRQQQGVRPQMVNGRPTFFTTYLSATAKSDEDLRDSNELVAKVDSTLLSDSIVEKAVVRIVEKELAEEPVVEAEIPAPENLATA